MRLPPCPPSQGNCSRQGETRCRPRSFFPPRSARETEEMEKWSFQRTRELMTPRALRGIAVNEIGRARISMMVRSMSSNSRPDTLVQDRTPQPHCFLLQRTAGPYIGVKRFQTIHCYSVDVARGLVLLFGIGTKALPLWDSRMRWSNLCSGLAVRRNGRSKRTCELTSSIVPRGTSFHCLVEFECPPIGFDSARISCCRCGLL